MAILLSFACQASAAPLRIISLKPNITEILFALGAGDRIVGVTAWCTYPPEAAALPKVADYVAPNIEKVVALRPDLVLGSQENSARQPIERLQKMGINVALLPFATPDATWGSIQEIGDLLNMPIAGKNLAERLRFATSVLEKTWAMFSRPRVLIVVGTSPLIAAGPNSLVGKALEMANGENMVTATDIAYPHISKETVIANSPDVIIDATAGMGERVLDSGMRLNDRISIDFFRPSPRLVAGLRELGEKIHMVKN